MAPYGVSGRCAAPVVVKNWRTPLGRFYGGDVARPRENPQAGRIAATRRKGRGPAVDRAERAPSGKAARGKKGKGRSAPASAAARAFKLLLLIAMMASLGFAVVLVADVSFKVLGGMKFGQITFAELVDKVQDRVFDHDVPEAKKKTTATPKPARPRASSSPSSSEPAVRAPLPAPRPEEYVKAIEARPDPEVAQARARLDQLLKGI